MSKLKYDLVFSFRQRRWAKYGASNALQYGWHKFLSHFRKGA